MPFENPLHDHAKRIIRYPTVQFQNSWPKAPSQYIFIFETINLVGSALWGADWTGDELKAVTWIESPRDERKRARMFRPSPPIPHSLARPYQKIPAKPEPIEHVKDWKAEELNKHWEANARASERLWKSVDWIALKCRDGELASFWRLRVGGQLRPMSAHEWNVDAPLLTFVQSGGNKRYCHEFKEVGPFETFVFFERAQLLDVLKMQPETAMIVGEADLSRLSPYLRLAVHVAMKRGYFEPGKCDTKDTREAEVREAWPAFISDIAPVKSTVEQIAKLMKFPEAESIEQGKRGARSRKTGSTPKI